MLLPCQNICTITFCVNKFTTVNNVCMFLIDDVLYTLVPTSIPNSLMLKISKWFFLARRRPCRGGPCQIVVFCINIFIHRTTTTLFYNIIPKRVLCYTQWVLRAYAPWPFGLKANDQSSHLYRNVLLSLLLFDKQTRPSTDKQNKTIQIQQTLGFFMENMEIQFELWWELHASNVYYST